MADPEQAARGHRPDAGTFVAANLRIHRRPIYFRCHRNAVFQFRICELRRNFTFDFLAGTKWMPFLPGNFFADNITAKPEVILKSC